MNDQDFPIQDSVGAWVPHGRFVVAGREDGALKGLTFAAKDLFDVAGYPTGAGNPTWLSTHDVPTTSSPIVTQLLDAGATLMGKTITDELAYSLHGENIHYGAPKNTKAPDRVTGGSSSGSAAAVAAGLVDFALGTDTGGSMRVPASYCGIWGLRTTHGLLSQSGLVPLHPSYDTPAWFASDPRVFKAVADVLLPQASYAPTSILRLDDACALADDVFAPLLDAVQTALEAKLGTQARTIALSDGQALESWRSVYMTSGAHEGWAVHRDWIESARPVFQPAISARWQSASTVTEAAADEARAQVQSIRAHIRSTVGANVVAFLPSAASAAPRRDADPKDVDAIRMRTMAITCIGGLSGQPFVNMPFAGADGTPLGICLMGPPGSDLALIELAIDVQNRAQKILEDRT